MNIKTLFQNKIFLLAGTAIFYIFFLFAFCHRHFNNNFTGFMWIGPLGRCPEVWSENLLVRDDEGYDSQFYYYMAIDPFIKNKAIYDCTGIDAYRYQRIFYPFLSWMISMGQRNVLPYVMLSINLISILLGTLWMIKLCDFFKANRLCSLFYPASVGLLVSFSRSTAEPLYLCLSVIGFYVYIVHKKVGISALFFSLAVLTKEVALLSVAGIIFYELLQRNRKWKEIGYFLFPAAAYALWQMNIYSHFHQFAFQVGVEGEFGILNSLRAYLDRLFFFLKSINEMSVRELFEPLLLLNLLIATALILYNFIAHLFKFGHPLQIASVLFAFSTLSAGFYPVRTADFWGYGRHSAEMFLAFIFFYVMQMKKYFLIPLFANSAVFFMILFRFFF